MAQLGVEEAATIVLSNPSNGMVLAHRFAAPGLEVLADWIVGSLINPQQNL